GIEVGAHSQTHPFLTRVSGDTLGREIAGSCADIEREVGVKPLSFCYPYGDVNLAVHAEAASAYAVAVTTELREVREERDFPHLIPRIDMYYFREPGELEEWGTPRFIRRLRLRKAGRQLRRGFATISSAWRS
ncbi:MAG: polysaccharide deacetylase family protein, partial [Gemmatimonadaceae bacterium]